MIFNDKKDIISELEWLAEDCEAIVEDIENYDASGYDIDATGEARAYAAIAKSLRGIIKKVKRLK